MDKILYNVPVPRLDGMTETQRNRALEDYMRESQRQLRMIHEQMLTDLAALTKRVEALEPDEEE